MLCQHASNINQNFDEIHKNNVKFANQETLPWTAGIVGCASHDWQMISVSIWQTGDIIKLR